MSMMFKQDESYNPMLINNGFLFNRNKDFLYYSLNGKIDSNSKIGDVKFKIFDTNDDKYGLITNGFGLSSKAKSRIKDLSLKDNAPDVRNSKENPAPVILSYRLAKALELKENDVFSIQVGSGKTKVDIY